MTYLEILTDICSQLGDPSLDTFKERAKDHLLRAISKLIQKDEFTVNDIPGYVKIKHGIDFADGGPEHLSDTGLTDATKWDLTGTCTLDTGLNQLIFTHDGVSFDGTFSQSVSNRTLAGLNSRYYKASITVGFDVGPSGSIALRMENFFSSLPTFDNPLVAGTKSIIGKTQSTASSVAVTFGLKDMGGNSVGDKLHITAPSLELLCEEHIYDLNIQKTLNFFVDPVRESGNNAGLAITLIDYAQLARMVANSELEPSDEEMFVIYDEGKLVLYITSGCAFVPGTDSISMQYVEWVDNSSWVDGTELTGTSSVAPLFSIPFLEKASEIAVQTLKAEEAQE